MKHCVTILLSCCCIFLFSHCQDSSFHDTQTYQGDFVYMDNQQFMLHDSAFFPLMVNYIVSFRSINNTFVVAPAKYYEDGDRYENETIEANNEQLKRHFALIKSLGFNGIRICFDRMEQKNSCYFYHTDGKNYYIGKDDKAIIKGLSILVDIAEKEGLKIMLLLHHPHNKKLQDFTKRLFKTFSNNPTIFAYDMMNEPLYFDCIKERSKESAIKLCRSWYNMKKKYAPHQLMTIGLAEPIEVFSWDASLLAIDFVQMHTYNPMRIKSEIYWYSKYINKPFMVGETGLAADNDSIPESMQTPFLQETYTYARSMGAIGFAWWEFYQCGNISFDSQHLGLIAYSDTSFIEVDGGIIKGRLKSFAHAFKDLHKLPLEKPYRPMNYYNMLGYQNICIKGHVADKKSRKAIEGAVIRAWNQDWTIGVNTFSDAQGNFTLYANDFCCHFTISAVGKTTVLPKRNLDYHYLTKDSTLIEQNLEYHSIDFRRYLKVKNANPYDFDSTFFSKNKIEANLGDIFLENL